MMRSEDRDRAKAPFREGTRLGRATSRGRNAARARLNAAMGGPRRAHVIIALAAVLALASADTATVGAAAVNLRNSLHIDNTDIGLLVAVTSLVGAIGAIPFGMLADRVRRTWTLAIAIVAWGAAMVWSATAGSFGDLLIARLALGAVIAAAGPIVASLVGDYFAAGERGRIYGFILTGELVGAGAGFVITGAVAAFSWRAAFVLLAVPALLIAYVVFRLPEPVRGGQSLRPEGVSEQSAEEAPEVPGVTDAQRLALDRGIAPDRRLLREGATRAMSFGAACRYVLHVRTNVALIISGACAYYFLAGVQTFGVEFAREQYRVGQALASLLMLLVGVGAACGVLLAGHLGDRLLARGRLRARVQVAAIASVAVVLLFIPVLTTHSWLTAFPYVVLAAGALSAQNPVVDAARLDIVPAFLWGRAEGIRTFIRTGAQALAPLVFGAVSDLLSGKHAHSGLQWTFIIMLLPLSVSAVFLFRANRTYPTDVVTAGMVMQRSSETAMKGGLPTVAPERPT